MFCSVTVQTAYRVQHDISGLELCLQTHIPLWATWKSVYSGHQFRTLNTTMKRFYCHEYRIGYCKAHVRQQFFGCVLDDFITSRTGADHNRHVTNSKNRKLDLIEGVSSPTESITHVTNCLGRDGTDQRRTRQIVFNSRQGNIFLITTASRPALGPTLPPVHRALCGLSGDEVNGA